MSNEFKVVSGSTNVLLIINGKGIPAQIMKPSDKDANEHWRFLVRDDRLSEFFPYVAQLEAHETCENIAPEYLNFLCSECGFVHYHNDENESDDGNDWAFCPQCRRAVKR